MGETAPPAAGLQAPPKLWPERLTYLAVAILAIAYCVHRSHVYVPGMPTFWDARVYARALQVWRAGGDPYRAAAPGTLGVWLPFVSPPLFLYLMGLLSHVLPGRVGWVGYLTLSSAAVLGIPWVLARSYCHSPRMPAALALFLVWFQPEKHGSQALLSGNLSNVLYAALLLAGVPGLRRNAWLPFYAVVVFAGLMKPPFLAWLLLPCLAGHAQGWRCLAAGVMALLGSLLQVLLVPGFWHEFQANVLARVVGQGDRGFGLLEQGTVLAQWLPARLHFDGTWFAALLLVILFLLLTAGRRYRTRGVAARLWVPCLVVFAVLANPRTLDYDADIAIVPAVVIAVEFCHSLSPSRWRSLLLGIALVTFAGVLVAAPDTAFCLLLVGSIGLTLLALFWPLEREGKHDTATVADLSA